MSKSPSLVLMMPDYRKDNPYQSLLASALEETGHAVCFPKGYRRVLPILRAVLDSGCDVLHLHWLSPYVKGSSVYSRTVYSVKMGLDLLLVRACGVRIVWTVHNMVSHEAQFSGIELKLRRFISRIAHRLIAHTAAAAAMSRAEYQVAPGKIAVVPHGHLRSIYGPPLSRKEARHRLGLPENARIYLNLGMLRPYKGLEDLLDAWRQHRMRHADDILLIAGQPLDDAYAASLRAQAVDMPEVDLRYGFVADSEIAAYLSAADVVVLPFRRILTSGSLILAMSYDKPVIAPDLPSIRETVQGATDLLFDPANRASLARSLAAAANADLDRLAKRTHGACSSLEWNLIGGRTSMVYESGRKSKGLTKFILEHAVLPRRHSASIEVA